MGALPCCTFAAKQGLRRRHKPTSARKHGAESQGGKWLCHLRVAKLFIMYLFSWWVGEKHTL